MDNDEAWNAFLQDHPIFSLPKSVSGPTGKGNLSLELSLNTLPRFTDINPNDDGPTPSGRRQSMVIKDADLLVASANEIRIASLGDSKLQKDSPKSYKVLHTPNVSFEIHTIALNPNSKLLAVVGAFQVAVIVLPRPGFMKLVPETIDCKSIQVGQYYHASSSATPIAKVEWHPWGEGGTTLLVMTTDGKLREYDIAVDTEEPQQVLSFVPERKSKSFVAEDLSEREVASFTLGKGHADWGPLSVYALMRSGDIYSICPYMPKNASIPSSYIHALECFVHAKQEFLAQSEADTTNSLSNLYEYQHKYVTSLIKQLPSGAAFPSTSQSFLLHPPNTIKTSPIRQGPFLLQPSPRNLDGSEGGDATDIVYLTFGTSSDEDDEGETERLGVVLVAYRDGKVDVCLDVEKVEAKWEHRYHKSNDLPMLAVYETIDLGFITNLNKVSSTSSDSSLLDLLEGNHPVFLRDPIQDETVYVYHAFGVHALQLGGVLQALGAALRDDDNEGEEELTKAVEESEGTTVLSIVSTFSVERQCSNPIVGVAIPNDVYLTYSIFILTSAMRVVCLPLSLRSELDTTDEVAGLSVSQNRGRLGRSLNQSLSKSVAANPDDPSAYVSLLTEPFEPAPVLTRIAGLPSNPRLALPPSPADAKGEFRLTPDTLRYLGTTFERFMAQIREVQLAYSAAKRRAELQRQEFKRQQDTCQQMLDMIDNLTGSRQPSTKGKLVALNEAQKRLLQREERILQSLTKQASPELSEHETKWFQELKRMKAEVTGSTRYDENSLQSRATLLRRELDRLMPSLKDLHEKEERLKKRLAEKQSIGLSQAFEYGERSSAERSKITRLEKEVLKLADKLEVTLGRPPAPPDNDKS